MLLLTDLFRNKEHMDFYKMTTMTCEIIKQRRYWNFSTWVSSTCRLHPNQDGPDCYKIHRIFVYYPHGYSPLLKKPRNKFTLL